VKLHKTIAAATTAGLLAGGALGLTATNAFAATNNGVASGAGVGPSAVPVVAVSPAAKIEAKLTPAQRRAKRHAALLARRQTMAIRKGLIGKVVSDSSSGGAFSAGQLVIAQADGSNFTFALTNRSHASMPQGLGKAAVGENASSIPVGEVVLVHGAQVENGVWWATLITESGFKAG
jgi:hypothetical protein